MGKHMCERSWRGLEALEQRLVFSVITGDDFSAIDMDYSASTNTTTGTWGNPNGGVQTTVTWIPAATPTLTTRGTLVVSGGFWDDVIGITRKGTSLRVVQSDSDGPRVWTFPFADVRRILVEGNAGHDKIAVRPTFHNPVTIVGGSGNDQLAAPQGATLIGGGGNDKLVCDVPGLDALGTADVYGPGEGFDEGTPRKRGLLSGGDGNDVLLTWRYDTVVGGRGDDTVYLDWDTALDPGDGLDGSVNLEFKFGGNASGVEHFNLLPLTIR